LPAVKVINPNVSPVIQQMTVKKKLLEQRLERHF